MVDAAATEGDMILDRTLEAINFTFPFVLPDFVPVTVAWFGGETFDVSLEINSDVFSKVKVPNGSNVSFFGESSGIFLMRKIGT